MVAHVVRSGSTRFNTCGLPEHPALAASNGRPYDPRHVSRSSEFLRSLVGPHVLFAVLVGAVHEWFSVSRYSDGSETLRIPWGLSIVLTDPGSLALASAVLFGLAAAGAAVLARRLTGNALVSACTGALLVLYPRDQNLEFFPILPSFSLNDVAASALGMFAAGVRLLPSPSLANAPLIGRREWVAIGALLLGSLFGAAILAMPLLILLSDFAYAPASASVVFRRTGKLLPLHLAAVSPAFILRPALDSVHGTYSALSLVFVACALMAVGVLSLRNRIRQTLLIVAAFAVAWAAIASLVPSWVADRVLSRPLLTFFGVALLIPTILWRIAVALTVPRHAPAAAELPLPSVPALRDLIRGMRAEPVAGGAAPTARKVDPTTGIRSTVESAVAGAVAATLEQIRLSFRGPHVTEPPGTPEQVLWNRLITNSSGGPIQSEKPEEALARWRAIASKHIEPRIKSKRGILLVGATPWPLVAALADDHASVTLVERSRRAAQLASADLGAARNVMVVRHDGKRLEPIGAGTVDVVISLFEPTRELPAEILALLREARRVLRPGGVAGIGFADLALPASQEALKSGAPAEIFVNREVLETLAGMAGFGACEVAASVLPTISIGWLSPDATKGSAP